MNLEKKMNTQLLLVLKKTHCLVFYTQMAHWLTRGRMFYSWHELFEKHYQHLFSLVDELAEMILIQEGEIEVDLSYYNHPPNVIFSIDQDKQLDFLQTQHTEVVVCLKEAIELSQSLGKEVIEDMLINHSAIHQKILWFYRSLKI